MLDIERLHHDIEYGSVHIVIKKHRGKIAEVDATRFYTEKLNDSKDAIKLIALYLRRCSIENTTGTAIIKLVLKHGRVQNLIMQDTKQEREA